MPQDPSVEIPCVGAGAAEEVLVKVVNEERATVEEVGSGIIVDDGCAELLPPLHVPKAELQPASQ